jgi:lantibiotic modifying enzyme
MPSSRENPHSLISRRDLLRTGAVAVVGTVLSSERLRAAGVVAESRLFAAAEGPDLDVALNAARWIRTTRMETANGATWPADPLKPASVGYDLYNGMPGVVLFHLELHAATADAAWLNEARAGADEIVARLPDLEKSADSGLYTGMAGIAFVLEETHRATGDARYREAAKRAIDAIHARAETAGSGAAWSGSSATNDIISGSSGIGLFLLWADRRIPDPRHRTTAAAAGRRLLEVAQPASGGLKWAVAPNVKNLYPNFSHGTAGVSYFLATLYRATGDRAFLDAALAGATYLQAVANADGKGCKVFHHEPGGEELYYLSWCHGPAGLSRLFYRLADVTSDERWLTMMRRAATAIQQSGVPEQRTPGFWNNISQCCGNSGVGEYFLTLNRVMPSAEYSAMVRRVADDTLRRATADGGGLKWVQAENRIQPDVVIAQTGFMQGAAGVGTFFLHKDAAARGSRARPDEWPDTPFACRGEPSSPCRLMNERSVT